MPDLIPYSHGPQDSATAHGDLATLEDGLERFPQDNFRTHLYSLQRYYSFFKRKWWILLLGISVFLGPGIAYIRKWPVSYAASARMWVPGRISLREGAVYDEQPLTFVETQVGLLQSDTIQRRALARLRQNHTFGSVLLADSDRSPFTLRVAQIRGGGLLELKAKGPTAESVCAFLNAIMEEFLAYRKETRVATSGDTYSSLAEQLAKEETELNTEQDKLTAFCRNGNIAVLEQQARAASEYLSQLLTELSQLTIESQLAERKSNQGQSLAVFGTNAVVHASEARRFNEHGWSFNQPEYLAAQQELEKIKIVRTRLSTYLRAKHPKIVKLDEEIARGEKLNDFFKQLTQEQLTAIRQGLKMRMEATQRTVKEWEAKLSAANDQIAEFQRLRANVERLQGVHDRLLNLLQSVDMGKTLDRETLSILDHASRAKPTKLPVIIVLALCISMGLFAGAALIFYMARLSDLVISTDDLRWRFGEWIVGQVPEQVKGRKDGQLMIRGTNTDDHGFAESYRNMRSALLFGVGHEENRKALLVTSAMPNEGKSTVAANLARALAFAGPRVLLVDGDLRCGRLHEFFQVAPGPGLAELLAQGGDPERFIVQTSVPGLFILPRGGAPHNVGELFLRPHIDLLLAYARKRYDRVILDSIPVFAADDTTSLAPKVDGVLFVVRSTFSSASAVQQALALLYERHAKVLGLVFNRANNASRPYNYDKYYNHAPSSKLTTGNP